MPGRAERVAVAIRKAVAELVLTQMRDPRLSNVSITGVDLTRDLSHAKIHVSVLGDESELLEAVEAMTAAGGYIRRQIAPLLGLRHMPELSFKPDDTAARAQRINALLTSEADEFTADDTADDTEDDTEDGTADDTEDDSDE